MRVFCRDRRLQAVVVRNVIDLTLFINNYLLSAGRSLHRKLSYLYYPVKTPAHENNLREELGISPETFVMGRIGRPSDRIFDPISLSALRLIEEKTGYDILYLVQSPSPAMIRTAREIGLEKITFLTTPVVSDDEVTSISPLPGPLLPFLSIEIRQWRY